MERSTADTKKEVLSLCRVVTSVTHGSPSYVNPLHSDNPYVDVTGK